MLEGKADLSILYFFNNQNISINELGTINVNRNRLFPVGTRIFPFYFTSIDLVLISQIFPEILNCGNIDSYCK